MSVKMISILDPSAEDEEEEEALALAVPELKGKVIGFLDNGWWSAKVSFARLATLLKDRYEPAEIVWRTYQEKAKDAPNEMVEELAAKCDAVICSLGN